ncbi:MAG TPA: FecR family protein [Mariniphaga anaerophila]|uniref:FecR family protein n=1 Tax=Mariniphaga anaerophila TaxID=1484053 RepID=A0A831LS84_9BACT|nr:FecR family protein [Mariniphaga anaerophila]
MKDTALKYFEGRATDNELNNLLDWLQKKENRIVFSSYRLDWKKSLESSQFPGGGEKSWQRLQATLGQKSYNRWQKSRKIQQFYRVAAIFFFVVSLGSMAWFFTHQPQTIPETFTSVMAENGQISKVELPDGSLVWLNSGSKITYNNYFSTNNRELTLTGEAYFHVQRSETLPMLVTCKGLQVKVLGTRFNINSFNAEHAVEVVLEEGSVELINTTINDNFYRMNPGERVNVNLETNLYSARKVNTIRYTSWREGVVNIYDLSIEDLVRRLEKRYNQKFELTPEVKKLRYTFTIENEPLEDVLKLMERITPVTVKQTDETIKIDIDKRKIREVGR